MSTQTTFQLGSLTIGHSRTKVIAEVAQAHDGSLGAAHAYIDAAAAAGADAVKFQTHIASAESTPSEPFRVKFSKQDASRYDYWKRMEFSKSQWAGLAEHAKEQGLEFLSSAFSNEAVQLLQEIGVRGWKVGAGEITNLPMLERMASSGPVLLSSGMSTWEELDQAVETVRRRGAAVAVFQCTSSYPCPPEQVGLNVIEELRRRYACPVGLSDHSGTIFAGLGAAALGADLLEVHIVFSRECFGPDVSVSLTPPELRQLTDGVRFLSTALANPVDKTEMAKKLEGMRQLFTKSIMASKDLDAGHILTDNDLMLRKPGTGLPAERLPQLLGKRINRALAKYELVTEDAVE